MISLLISLYSRVQKKDSLPTLLKSDTGHDLVLFSIDRGDGNGDRRRDNTSFGRRVGDIGTDHESILGKELGHGYLVSHTSELGMDLHRH